MNSLIRKLEEEYKKNFSIFSRKREGIRYLKVRTLFDYECLKSYDSVRQFLREYGIKLPRKITREISKKVMEQVYLNKKISNEELNRLAKKAYEEKRASLFQHINISELINDLRKVASTNEYWQAWNSVYRDDIRKHIQHHFVRDTSIWRLEDLLSRIDEKLLPVVKGYTVISWYNQWTSTLIEDIIMRHKKIIPTVRKIDKVDFFLKLNDVEIPMDLKVTFVPRGYMKKYMRSTTQHSKGISLIKNLISNTTLKRNLIKWLYENQGKARFSDSNRLFIVLINVSDIEDSWRLKADIPFIESKIYSYLDSLTEIPEVEWTWEERRYKTLSDIIFIIKGSEEGKTYERLDNYFKLS